MRHDGPRTSGQRVMAAIVSIAGLVFIGAFIPISIAMTGGTLFSVPFVAVGVAIGCGCLFMLYQAVRGPVERGEHGDFGAPPGTMAGSTGPAKPGAPGRLACAHCAAPLRDDTEISPSGDVKCPYCRSWFNVRG